MENMGFDSLISSNCEAGEMDEKRGQKISAENHVNGVQHSDSFVLDVESFSHLIEKDMNSRIARNVSRKGSLRGGDKKISPTTTNQINASLLATSPAATRTPEEPVVVALGATDHSASPKLHHPITIKNTGLSSPAAESKRHGNRSRFRRTPPTWFTDPRKILMFFATLSSLGTILLIYFTLSMGRLNVDENDLS